MAETESVQASTALVQMASSSLAAALASATAAHPALSDITQYDNMSGLAFDEFAYSLNDTQTGCYRKGAFPVALAQNDTCELGFYCPNSSNDFPPQYCPPTEQCQILRATHKTCNPQGFSEPKICADGHYCPPGGRQQIPCPKGTFCPSGSYQPWKCDLAAWCPAMSSRMIVTVPIGVTAMVDLALGLVLATWLGIMRWRKRRPKYYTTLDFKGQDDDIELLAAKKSMGMCVSPRLSVSGPLDVSPVRRPSSTHSRRASGRVDNMDGQYDSGDDLPYDEMDSLDDDFHNSPDMQRFIRSMAKTIETNSIGLSFDFESLSFATRKGNTILDGVTGSMPRGSCWGVMGGSGAGKSTFVKILMGKLHATSGTIKINGWVKDLHEYNRIIGYVPQDDVVLPELTVRENILHSARIRLPSTWRDSAIQDHVDSLIACLQLSQVQHSLVGDARKPVISGGQRKRVNIGMELAAAPMAIFLDEPTSGLDSGSAATIMRLLKAISRLGVTTISIIHQPREDIFYGFDQLLLLAQGSTVYSGPTEDAQSYFESLGYVFPTRGNPADTIIDIITGDGGRYLHNFGQRNDEVSTLIQSWKTKGQYSTHSKHLSVGLGLDGAAEAPRRKTRRLSSGSTHSTAEQEESLQRTAKARGASWPAQVFYCWKRAMLQQIRNASSFFFEIGVGALSGIVIGLSAFASNGHLFQGIYRRNFILLSSAVDYISTPQLGLLSAMAIGLAASAPGFWVFGEEKQQYEREAASGHSRSAYYLGKVLSTLPRIALSSLHFTVFLGILATPLITFQHMYLANLAYFFGVYGSASIVSMLVKREDGPLIAVLVSLIIGVLGGVAPPLSKVKLWHMGWFWRMSPSVWFTEIYISGNWTPLSYLYDVELAAEIVGFTLGRFAWDIGMLFLIGFAYRIIAYLGLTLVHRDRQR